MSSNFFSFQQFVVYHDGAAMKVGTDGVLLGLLSPISQGHILDIGTGSGLVSLLLAQRTAHFPDTSIVGIDIDPSATCQARENFRSSPWSGRLNAVLSDVADYCPPQPFNLIVSNPPFYEHSPQSSSLQRDISRSGACGLSLDSLARHAARLLAPDGILCVILPLAEAEKFTHLSWENNLSIIHRHQIITKEGKSPKRTILTFTNGIPASSIPQTTAFTLMDTQGNRSEEYQKLVADYFIR